MIECNIYNCKARYIGETEIYLHDKICEHIGDVRNKNIEKSVGNHFNLPGHTLSNMIVTTLEKVNVNNTQYRKEREKYLIRKFNIFYSGLYLKP